MKSKIIFIGLMAALVNATSWAETEEQEKARRQAALQELLKKSGYQQPDENSPEMKRYRLAQSDPRMAIWASPKCAGYRYVLEKDPKAELLDKIERECIKPWASLLLR